MRTLNVKITDDMHAQVDDAAREASRQLERGRVSMAEIVRRALEAYLKITSAQ